ncbi:hypothetical protein GCWU000322_00083 [Eubacterium saphenum ATCC 49989]|nr:hypothetical protein GCWU000322_00083 [Eubacterium saphenum ATCC 49989]
MGIKVKIDEGRFTRRFTARFEPLLAHEVKRLCDPYVPFDRGDLKGSARTVGSSVWYSTPYARRQYYEHKGDGLRGARWEQLMLRSKGAELTAAIQKLVERG